MFKVELSEKAKKQLNKLPYQYHQRALSALLELQSNPYMGKKLHGEYKEHYSIRVWPYRLVYKTYPTKKVIIVIRIAHRQEAYGN